MSKLANEEKVAGDTYIYGVDLPPGQCMAYRFSDLIRFAEAHEINLAEWGICEHDNCYWESYEAFLGNQSLLRLSLLEIKEQRDREYAEWGDEEVYVIVGRTLPNAEFTWFLLSEPELNEDMHEVEFHRPEDLN